MIPLKLAAKFRKFDRGKEIRIRSQNLAVAAGLGMADMINISNVEILRFPDMGCVEDDGTAVNLKASGSSRMRTDRMAGTCG